MPGTSRTSKAAIAKRERQVKALQLRAAGLEFREIARNLGVSVSTAHGWVSDAIKEITRDSAETVLNLELVRLEQLQTGVWAQARKGDDKAVASALRIMDHRAKLLGLYRIADQRATGAGHELSAVESWLDAMTGSCS